MNKDILTNGSTVKNHISFKKRYSNTVQQGELRSDRGSRLSTSSSSSLPSSTSMTPSRQEIDHSKSSSSSSTSPTLTSSTVSSDSVTGAREEPSGIDSHPVLVSSMLKMER